MSRERDRGERKERGRRRRRLILTGGEKRDEQGERSGREKGEERSGREKREEECGGLGEFLIL